MLQDFLKRAGEIRQLFDKQQNAALEKLSSRLVEDLRVHFLGRKGAVTALFENLRYVSKEDRPSAGKTVNELRAQIEAAIDALKSQADEADLRSLLEAPGPDVTLPVVEQSGSLHPVSLMREQLLREFRRLGFVVYDGPEIDLDFYNFSALNFPDDHPARDMQDTFFVKSLGMSVLRTHTSNIQIHSMLQEEPPLKIVSTGRTFRCDSDLTHTPMFHQIEALIIDEGISMAHMKGIIDYFLKSIYGNDISTRIRPSFFPFVEPGAEVDMQCVSCRGKGCRVCKQTGWLEIGGCGMVHPNVLDAVRYDSEKYSGFAFGFGIDRMAMLKYDLPDLRSLFTGQTDLLAQFPIYTC